MEWLEPAEFGPWRRMLEIERRAGHLTPARRDCLRALLCFYGTEGLWPSDAAVAALACHGISTVRRARLDARALGLLTWQHTRKEVDGRRVQGPNCYAIRLPSPLVCPDVQGERGRSVRKKSDIGIPISEPRQQVMFDPQAREALAVIAARRLPALALRADHRMTG